MKKLITVVLIVAIAVGAAVLLKKRKAQLAKAKPAAVLPVVVEQTELKLSTVRLTLPALGVVASDLSTTLSTKVSGRVLKVFKQEGDVVHKGEKLATIDAADLTAKKQGLLLKSQGLDFRIAANRENIKALQTALAAARETHQRTIELLKIKGASVEQSRREEAEIAKIQAQLSAARNGISTLMKEKQTLAQNVREIDALLSYTRITAPIDGILSKRLVMPGDLATPGKPLFRIAASTGLYLNLSLPDTLHAKQILLAGEPVYLAAKNQSSAAGLVQYIAQIPDGSAMVEGQYVNVRVVVFVGEDVLIPVDALLSVNGRTAVFVLSNGRARKVPVHIKARGSEGVVVAEKLAGQRIAVAKPDILLRLATGAPVLAQTMAPTGV